LPVLYTKYYSGDKIKKNEMGGTHSTYGGEERCIRGFYGGNLGDLVPDERIILKLIFKKLDGEACI
jgi:hypothetical protein